MQDEDHFCTEHFSQPFLQPFSVAAADAADKAAVAVQELENRLSLRNRDSGNFDESRVYSDNWEPRLCLSTCFPAHHGPVLPQDVSSHDSFGPDVMVHFHIFVNVSDLFNMICCN
jgi:hypothetical protein